MTTAKQLNKILNKIAPYELAESWDNCGLLIDCGGETDKILFALDLTNAVVAEAAALGCGVIVTHHPAIFQGVKALADGDPVLAAARAGVSVLSVHTCFDAAAGGVNDVLCEKLGVDAPELFAIIGRGGNIKRTDALTLAVNVKNVLRCSVVRYVDGGKPIERVAVIGGSAGEFIGEASWQGYDAFVTGELKHHEAIYAKQLGLTVIAAGHFETENPAMDALRAAVESALDGAADCLLSTACANPLETV